MQFVDKSAWMRWLGWISGMGFSMAQWQWAHDAEQLLHLCQSGDAPIVHHCSLVASPLGSVMSQG